MSNLHHEVKSLWNKNFCIITIASFLMFTAFYMLMPIIAKYCVERFNTSASLAGVVVASYIISALLSRPFTGFLVDSLNRKKLFIVGYGIFMLLVFGYTLASTVALLILVRILLGATFSLVTTSANTLAIDLVPSERRGEGIGYMGAITVLAMAFGPMMGLYLIELFSYEGLFITSGISCLIGFILIFSLKVPFRPKVKHDVISLDRFFLVESMPVAIVASMLQFSMGILMVYVPLFLEEVELPTTSGNFFLLYAIGVVISRASSGKLLNRGLYNTLMYLGICGIIAGIGAFAFFLNMTTFIIFSVVLGLSYGLTSPSMQSMIVNLVPHTRRGTANSTFFIALDTGSGTGMLVGGAIASTFSYSGLFMGCTVLNIAAFLVYHFYTSSKYKRLLASRGNF